MKLFHGPKPEHKECWDLLPWMANERLSQSDALRLEEHLQECESCRGELASQRRLREAIRAEESVVLAPQASLQKLMYRIELDGEPERLDALLDTAPSRGARRTHRPRTPRWFAIAASVQAAVIALLFVALGWQAQDRVTAPRFSTLTSPSSVARGPVIRVVFDEAIELGELKELLRSIDAHIVAGPSSAGVFTLQLAEARRSSEEVERIAAALRQDSRVRFSEPAVAEAAGK